MEIEPEHTEELAHQNDTSVDQFEDIWINMVGMETF